MIIYNMLEHRLVNWKSSMNLSDEHFRQTENYFINAIADALHIHTSKYGYGLLPLHTQKRNYNDIRVNEQLAGHIEVQLYSCNAVTASGFRIEFDADKNGSPLIIKYSPAEDKSNRNRDVRQWDILLSVDPFKRIAFGEPDPDEIPPRHPDADRSYGLYVVPVGDINTTEFGSHYLTIGRVRKDGERYMVDTQYIPPCATMSAHPELLDYYNSFATMFYSIEKSSKTIIEKIHDRANNSDLAVNIQSICQDLLRYISHIYFNFKNKGRMSAPIEVVNYISSTAHTFYVAMTLVNNKQKELMLKYFYEWSDVAPGAFEELLSSTLDFRYEHDNLRSMMVRSEHFLHTLMDLWERLARLEFIGQHKESIVVSANEYENRSSGPGASGGWIVKN